MEYLWSNNSLEPSLHLCFSSEDWKATVDTLKTDLNCGRLMKRFQLFCWSFRLREESRRATGETWTWFSGLQGFYSSWPLGQPRHESARDIEYIPPDSWVCGGPIHAGTSNPTYGLNGRWPQHSGAGHGILTLAYSDTPAKIPQKCSNQELTLMVLGHGAL